MYTDNTLTPKEAIRLCALGTLAVKTYRYSVLANSVRHFISHMLGPSLDMMGSSIELLKYEGLVQSLHHNDTTDEEEVAITSAGRTELRNLLTANVRSSAQDLNDLIIALKFRFLHLLPAIDQKDQIALLMDVCEAELGRLENLRSHHSNDAGHLASWLDQALNETEARLAWLNQFEKTL
jgi:DNA-binding PadR family transcriptional regulator